MKKPDDLFYKTILAVNTSEREAVELGLIDEGKVTAVERFPVRSQDLQATIVDFLAANHVPIDRLKALAIVRQGESLTGTRMGIAAINTLGWLQNIPIIELDQADFKLSLDRLVAGETSLKAVKQTSPLS